MSRLYGRAFDVYQMSKTIADTSLPKYKEDNSKISLDNLIDSSAILDFYLPREAIDYVINYPIHIVKSPLFPRNMSQFPNVENPNATIYFKGTKFKEENKRDLNFFLGCVLSHVSQDENPKTDDLPCEYGDLFPLLLEYLYLKENKEEDRFILKHLHSLKRNSDKYCRSYDAYHKYLVSNQERNFMYLNAEDLEKIKQQDKKNERDFLSLTLNTLVPLSSVDGILQITDKIKSPDDYKKLIKELYENPNNNRQEILKDYNIESYGYKRLRKEIESRGIRK